MHAQRAARPGTLSDAHDFHSRGSGRITSATDERDALTALTPGPHPLGRKRSLPSDGSESGSASSSQRKRIRLELELERLPESWQREWRKLQREEDDIHAALEERNARQEERVRQHEEEVGRMEEKARQLGSKAKQLAERWRAGEDMTLEHDEYKMEVRSTMLMGIKWWMDAFPGQIPGEMMQRFSAICSNVV